MGDFNGELMYAENTFESDNNVASYWLPMENDFLKSYPISGLNEEKLLKSMEKVGKSSKSLPIGDLIKNADEIDLNNKIAAQIANQANHNYILYAITAFLFTYITVITIIFNKKENKTEMKK